MERHEPDGKLVCIHSVTVVPEFRRQGLGLAMLREYLTALRARRLYSGAALICHDELIEFYRQAGFRLIGESAVVHGPDPWFDMTCDL